MRSDPDARADPEPTPETQACTLPDQPTSSPNCSEETPQFGAELVRAQDKIRAEQPSLFTPEGRVISVDYIVLGSGETWSTYTVTCRPARF